MSFIPEGAFIENDCFMFSAVLRKKELNCTTTVWKLQMHNRSKHWLCFNTAQLLYLLSECGQEQLIIPTNDRHNKYYSADGRCGNHYISQLFPFCGVLVRKALQGCSLVTCWGTQREGTGFTNTRTIKTAVSSAAVTLMESIQQLVDHALVIGQPWVFPSLTGAVLLADLSPFLTRNPNNPVLYYLAATVH